ncbi:hypothetical protein TH61_08410 [Rufibacter sp. DG15C]|uniref:hypothetical protein n=1 Tax=Rufibacter sp. DG15C TaxID=1379909 RepID=UPI00078B8108|nr:hypothetical protein [Rufibacter sp. DG15C]AMM51196.1 hypothetical protein TH61_08410 [Rufibacter sp. DG15C]
MKITNQILVVAVAVLGMACSADKKSTNGKDGFTPQPINFASTPAPGDSGKAVAGLNPPHGQMGHRCDIEVGAPLNSAPKASLPTTTTVNPTPTPVPVTPQPVQVSPQPVATAPGMNPPHGQPGHSCAVAVGAPLPK